jgi:chemotaxis protein methyltransferase CheR
LWTNVPDLTNECGSGWTSPSVTDAEFTQFRGLILKHAGIHLNGSKRHLLVSRLMRRLRELNLHTFAAYYEYVAGDTSGRELSTFINRMTTNKTSFFREPHHFEFLTERMIPEISARGERRMRIWSAACSSGEEPYTIAMTIREAQRTAGGWDVRILGSDIDTQVLAKAESGTYDIEALSNVPEMRRKAHFLRGYGGFEGQVQIRPALRRMIDFRQINLIGPAWPIRTRFDAIFCRNALIYFQQPVQHQIVNRLIGYLRPGGYFFAGHSESLHSLREILVPVGHTVYRLNGGGKS